ncbi:acyl carrier protein [Candidatus Curtissbacteria bacterium]|nr:acyl carrier protein [Candidatus Curtissbacteria bacterium]
MTDTFEEIKKMLAHQFGLNPEEIEEDSLLDEDLSITDLDLEDLVTSIQSKFDIEIPQEKFPSFKKVSDIVAYIDDHGEISG